MLYFPFNTALIQASLPYSANYWGSLFTYRRKFSILSHLFFLGSSFLIFLWICRFSCYLLLLWFNFNTGFFWCLHFWNSICFFIFLVPCFLMFYDIFWIFLVSCFWYFILYFFLFHFILFMVSTFFMYHLLLRSFLILCSQICNIWGLISKYLSFS